MATTETSTTTMFDNPITDSTSVPENTTPRDGLPTPGADGSAAENHTWREELGILYKKNNCAWLLRREAAQNKKIAEEKMNWKYNPETQSMEDLGPVITTMAFCFQMGVNDNYEPKTNEAKALAEVKARYGPEDWIPLEAWQVCHRLWKQNFHIEHSFSATGEYLIIAIGLPYKILLEEATHERTDMRLRNTKGSHDFKEEFVEKYPVMPSGCCFSSALMQSLAVNRLNRKAHVYPETMGRVPNKMSTLKPVRSLYKRNHEIRGRSLYTMFRSFGCYRPHASEIFGVGISHLAKVVLDDEWITFSPPTGNKPAAKSMIALAKEHEMGHHIEWKDIGTCLQILQEWQDSSGRFEKFDGTFLKFFALHDKPVLAELRAKWGTFAVLKKFYCLGKPSEDVSTFAYYHPGTKETQQISLFYQPIDEIRDYFGDHTALYFAWIGVYTHCLVFPTVFGIIGMISQFIAGEVDDNITTTPYSVFFAAWSISFLSTWKRKENSLKFLWGTEGFEIRERPRPEFSGLHVINPETKRDEVIYTGAKQRTVKFAISFSISWCFIGFTIASALAATGYKDSNKYTTNQLKGSCCGAAPWTQMSGMDFSGENPLDVNSCCGCWKLVEECVYDISNPGEEERCIKRKGSCPASLDTFGVGVSAGSCVLGNNVISGKDANTPGLAAQCSAMSDNSTACTSNKMCRYQYETDRTGMGCYIEDIVEESGCTAIGGAWNTLGNYDKYKYMATAAILNLSIILIYGIVYEKLAELLTNWENHRTITEWEDSVIIKNFMFQFINNYFVLFYISYMRTFMADCKEKKLGKGMLCIASDLTELQFQLLIVFTGKTIGWRLGEILQPKVATWFAEFKKIRKIMAVLQSMEDMVHSAEHALGLDTETEAEAYARIDDEEMEAARKQTEEQTAAAIKIQKCVRGRQIRSGGFESRVAEFNKEYLNRVATDHTSLVERIKGGKGAETFEVSPRPQVGDDEVHEVHDDEVHELAQKKKTAIHALDNSTKKKDLKKSLQATYEDDSNIEDEVAMVEFESSFDEFNEMAVQYGYLALFAPAYPLAPLLALINNVFEIRIDSVKMCTVLQRPRFRQCEDIGAWYSVLNVLGFAAVLTNASMIAFVGSQMADDEEVGGPNGWGENQCHPMIAETAGGAEFVKHPLVCDISRCTSLAGTVIRATGEECDKDGCFLDETSCPENGEAGYRLRMYSHKLWVVMVIIEHSVMLMRVAILRFTPEVPEWISEAKDVLNFRVDQWEAGIEAMKEEGFTVEAIHDQMLKENVAVQTQADPKRLVGVLKLGASMIPGLATGGPKKLKPQLANPFQDA